MFSWEISLGAVINGVFNFAMITVAGVSFYYSIKFFIQRTAEQLRDVAEEMHGIKVDLKELTKVLTIQAVQDEKILSSQQALAAFRGEYNERHRSLTERIERLENSVYRRGGDGALGSRPK